MVIEINYDESRTKHKQRNDILQTAYELFLDQGIENVSMQDIAAACNIQRRSLYNYYSQKEEIALDLMKCWYKSITGMMVFDIPANANGYEAICTAFYQFYDKLIENSDLIRYSVHFDHYFRREYNDQFFDSEIVSYFTDIHDTSIFEKGLEDGSIKPKYKSTARQTMLTMATSVLALAQRVMFREDIIRQESGITTDSIRVLIDLMLEAIHS